VDFDVLSKIDGVHKVFTIRRNKRQTCFVSVRVIEETRASASSIDWSDVRVDTFRSSGHGGQGVNTTDSAVRMVHVPTGLTVVNRTERSQLVNKELCRDRLASLYEESQKKEKERALPNAKFGRSDMQYWEHEIKKAIERSL
jgi:peptide chain release factor 2